MVKLSELKDDVLIVEAWDNTPITVADLRSKIENGVYDGGDYYLTKPSQWRPDAFEMVKTYIQSESLSQHDDFEEVAEDLVTDEHIQELQGVLNKIYNKDTLKQFFTISNKIEIDIQGGDK